MLCGKEGFTMRNLFAGSILTTATMLALFSLALTPAAGQGQQKGAAKAGPRIIQPKAGSPPAPRLPDGHVDLGNGKGAWSPVVIKDLTGHGYGDTNL